jgi:transposase
MTQYGEEFREEAVGLVLESRGSISQVARDLGVSVWTLRGWVKKHREKSGADQPRRAETVEEENKRLKRELAILRQERDILKKAAAYFAKEQL